MRTLEWTRAPRDGQNHQSKPSVKNFKKLKNCVCACVCVSVCGCVCECVGEYVSGWVWGSNPRMDKGSQ